MSDEDLRAFHAQGFVLKRGFFTAAEAQRLSQTRAVLSLKD